MKAANNCHSNRQLDNVAVIIDLRGQLQYLITVDAIGNDEFCSLFNFLLIFWFIKRFSAKSYLRRKQYF